jgi:hypothetical protein
MRMLLCVLAVACGSRAAPTGPANKPVTPSGEPYALAIVVSGWEMWMGNDKFLDHDDPSRYAGALEAIKGAVFNSTFAKTAPAGSQGMLVTYADHAHERVPMGPIAKLDDAAFGVQKDYFGQTGVELVAGVERAAAALDKVPAGRKFLFVLGDGNDTNNEVTGPRFAELAASYANKRIEVVAFIWKAPLSGERDVITKLARESHVAANTAELSSQLQDALDGLAARARR